MKKVFDIFLALLLLPIFLLPMAIITVLIKATSKGPVLYWSYRIGKNNAVYRMPKFRSMQIDTPVVATHLLETPESHLSPVGGFLRASSLDELPQFFSVLKGDMSFVGPRPALYNQYDLIDLRTKQGIDQLLPGITGWAQINGRDEISIAEKVELDASYLQHQSFWFDIKILYKTFLKVVKHTGVSH